ncbi:ferrochelatase [Rhodococcus ruber]|uniref:Coproporphyrin III ferrochelatase n=1 Tax=Rhodococcus ruber TaxID=1830 RepID=A0A098BIA0_9NOCA|nr:ferrochelatase [Rhodococcus ruber]MDO2381578.1 ferrochelatase [Rhodococcus ruber]MCD2128467.1 ferrochelatase [Rhodococcus ruber]MCZ4503532.1 ferrochelatase [Rhodococcus ruber]MCZ4530428.1 ferrochelatase [Rhodococcus ruber]MCZ4621376.1 ferrochelatase [Rhodococcus ruber]
MTRTPEPYDALLVLSFGGPEGPDDVRPFLENVTRGRGVPPERLDEVAEHYLHFGGVSPINALNRDLIARLEVDFAAAGLDLPIYFGNRNWHPMIEDTVAAMRGDGVRNALVFPTSAWGGYSGCRQYHEDIARARAAVGDDAPALTKLRHFYDHPLFLAAVADAVAAARAQLPADRRDAARLVFTAHSVPTAADATGGPPDLGGHLYSRQVAEAARLVATATGTGDHDLVWQSRSGPPQVPWLEPDIVDHLDALHARGIDAVVVVPVGFVSDHLEVVWDLDTEARDRAAELGMAFIRAATAGTDPRFVQMVRELVRERLDGAAPVRRGTEPLLGVGCNGELCAPECCRPPARPRR